LQELGQRPRLLAPIGHDHAASDEHDGKARLGEHAGRLVQALPSAGPAFDPLCRGNRGVELAIEMVARDVDLNRPPLGHGDGKGAVGELGDPIRPAHVGLVACGPPRG
jgi:hypothetical protein